MLAHGRLTLARPCRPQPFIEEGHPLRKLFPPTEALLLPACLAISVTVGAICVHVGALLVRDGLSGGGR